MLQLPGVVNQPLIFYSALTSLLCSLMSLLYGCMYIIRFGSMRKTYRAIAWAEVSCLMLRALGFDSDVAGSSKHKDGHLVECLGVTCDASRVVSLVRICKPPIS